jgi:adenosylcobyric acid synthase
MTRAIMILGTGSDVGKSLIVAGLARSFTRQGLRVAPFKPQNMSNNAAVTIDGGEIGRAQALQARAARRNPITDMNPLLLKPESQTGAQIVLHGKRVDTLSAKAFFGQRQRFMPAILESFDRLKTSTDLILVEGAGSPAEANLRDGDLANLGFATAANISAMLVGDIHRGGVIASIIGTMAVLSPADAARIKAFLINKFHGDPTLFDNGRKLIEQRTGLASLGIVPHFAKANRLPAEDAVTLEEQSLNNSKGTVISVLRLPRIANFDDLDPLRLEPNVAVTFVIEGQTIPPESRLVIIPGSKSTMADLAYVRQQGWDIDLAAHMRRGGHVLGLCGGYQMLGKAIHDPQGLEGPAGSVKGLGALDIETTLHPAKTLALTSATHHASGTPISAYEIHLGKSEGPDCARPFARLASGATDGASSATGRITGTYMHGCFSSDAFRQSFLTSLNIKTSALQFEDEIETVLDQLADHMETHIDMKTLLALAAPC